MKILQLLYPLLNKIWVFLQILNLSGPGGQVLRLASCMPVSWSSFPTGFHFCEGHNIPFFRFVSFLFYVFFPYIFLVSITPRLSPCHCPFHPRVIALVMALPWPVEFSIFFECGNSLFFLTNSNVSAFLYFCHRVQEFLCDTTR